MSPVAFDVSMPSRSDRNTMSRSPSSRVVVITSAALRPKRSMPTTTIASPSQGAERLNPILGAAATACLGAEAPQRRSYGRRRSERQARQVTRRRRRAFLLRPLARSSGLGGGWWCPAHEARWPPWIWRCRSGHRSAGSSRRNRISERCHRRPSRLKGAWNVGEYHRRLVAEVNLGCVCAGQPTSPLVTRGSSTFLLPPPNICLARYDLL
jgi:hypothetical protein